MTQLAPPPRPAPPSFFKSLFPLFFVPPPFKVSHSISDHLIFQKFPWWLSMCIYMYFIFWEKWQPFCFWKKNWKIFFSSHFKGPKIKNRLFYEFIPGFPERLGRIVFEHWKWGYIMWSVKSVALQNLPFLEKNLWKKLANFGAQETNVHNWEGLWKFG